jgi:hypothetical protein
MIPCSWQVVTNALGIYDVFNFRMDATDSLKHSEPPPKLQDITGKGKAILAKGCAGPLG